MPSLILVRHSLPEIDPDLPASQWRLSQEGRQRCAPLADALAAFAADVIVTSVEPKAAETGRLAAEHLSIPCESAAGLHEHARETVGWLGQETFQALVAQLFAQPDQRVMGEESADQAHRRFAAAVQDTLAQHPEQNVAIVTHGTVLTLFVSRAAGVEPLPFWRQLGLPALIVLSQPRLEIQEAMLEISGKEL